MGRLFGLGLTYAEAKAGPMAQDTVEGAELGVAIGPTLRRMMEDGRLDPHRLPLTRAILATLLDKAAFVADYAAFHR